MLRKQTIWLLTMLSLVVVLSIYYVTGEPTSQTASDVSSDTASSSEEDTQTGEEVSNQAFDELRMSLADERSQLKDDLEGIITSADATAEDKSEARDKMIAMEETGQKEEMLEVLIESIGYKDAFVKVDEDKGEVSIRIQSEELTKEQANKIIQLTESELGVSQVAISYQS